MRELIKRILNEQIFNKETDDIESFFNYVKNALEKLYPNINITYKFYRNKSEGKFFIDIKNNENNYKKIWDDITFNIKKILRQHPSSDENQNFIYNFGKIDFHPDVKQKFYNSDYIQNRLDAIKTANLDYKEFINDFDGYKSEKLEKSINYVNYLTSEDFLSELKNFLQTKTDVPLTIKLKTTKTFKTVLLEITPNLTLDDFLNCNYKFWGFKQEFGDVYELIKKEFPNIPSDVPLEVDLVWPREVGNYIVNKQEEFKSKLPIDLRGKYAVKINFDICGKDPKIIYVGSPIDDEITEQNKNIFIQIKDEMFPKSKIDFNRFGYYAVNRSYKVDDKRYWTKEQLFDYFVTTSKNKLGNSYSYDINKFIDLETLTEVYCEQHKKWFEVLPLEHIGGKRCPFDNESKGESMVRVYLEKNKIPFKQYHKLKGCFSEINGRCILLTFDFYLPEQNTVIEYDGEQHYKPVERFGGEETYKRQVILDGIKNAFCDKSNIKMIRIPYTIKKPKDIQDLLNQQLGIK